MIIGTTLSNSVIMNEPHCLVCELHQKLPIAEASYKIIVCFSTLWVCIWNQQSTVQLTLHVMPGQFMMALCPFPSLLLPGWQHFASQEVLVTLKKSYPKICESGTSILTSAKSWLVPVMSEIENALFREGMFSFCIKSKWHETTCLYTVLDSC